MEFTKIIFSIVVLLLFIFFGGNATISFKSPYVYVERPWIVVGIILLSLAIGALQYDSYCQGKIDMKKEILGKKL